MENIRGVITEIKRFATHDGPGIRVTVFLKGCPLRCRWCCNPETLVKDFQLYFVKRRCGDCERCVNVCPVGAISTNRDKKIDRDRCSLCFKCVEVCPNGALRKVGEEVAVEKVLAEVLKDKPFFGSDGGITLSGGEPLYQPDFAIALLRASRESGITTVLDTSGFAPREVIEEALRWTDLVLLDIKHMDPERHREGTGVRNELILENAVIMADRVNVRVSLPLIPGYNDDEENIRETAKFASSIGVKWIDINPLHILGSDKYRALDMRVPYGEFEEVSKERLKEIISLIRNFGIETTIGRMM